jgi:hypothetical protein
MSDDLYTVSAPSGNWANVIFCRMSPNSSNDWNNRWTQTKNLTYDGSKNYWIVSNSALTDSDKNANPSTSIINVTVAGNGSGKSPWCGGKDWDVLASKLDKYGSITFSKVAADEFLFKVVINGDIWLGYDNLDDNSKNVCTNSDGNIKFTTASCSDLTIKFIDGKISVTITTLPTKYYLTGIAGNNKIEMSLQGTEYVLLKQPVKSTDVVKVLVESGCGNVEYTALNVVSD